MSNPQPVDHEPRPDFGAAIATVAERVKSFKDIAIAVGTVASAIAAAGFGAWTYFASREELRHERCLIEAQATTESYNERMDLYDLLLDAKTRIKAILAGDLANLSEAGKVEQIARIAAINRELDGIQKRRGIAVDENKAAIRTLEVNKCPSDQTSKATEKGSKQ